MTEQNLSAAAQPANAQAGAAPQGAGAGEQTEVKAPAYVTKEELAEIVAAQLDKFSRIQQSERGKMAQAFNQKLQEQAETLKSLGLDPAQYRQQMERRAREQVDAQFSAQPEGEKPLPAEVKEPETPQGIDLDAIAGEIMDDEGVELLDNDPEVSEVISDQGKAKFIKSLLAAIEKKRERIARANTPITGGMPPASQDALADELVRLLREPSKNRARIAELRNLLK